MRFLRGHYQQVLAARLLYLSNMVVCAAARLATEGNHSLHIGLGIGVASKTLAEFGETTDVIDIHPEVPYSER